MTAHSVVRSRYGPGTDQTVAGTLAVEGDLVVTNPAPKLLWIETDAAADNARWDVVVAVELWRLRLIDDAGAVNDIMQVSRTGLLVDLINFFGPVRVDTFGVGVAPIARPAVAGSRGANVALASLLTALDAYGLITDNTVI